MNDNKHEFTKEEIDELEIKTAHAHGYMVGIIDGYSDIARIMQNLIDTMPITMKLTPDGQANIALLKNIIQGTEAKIDMGKKQLEKANNALKVALKGGAK